MEFREITAKTVDEAITKACLEFGISSDNLEIEVVREGTSGFFGIGSKPAIIRVRRKAEEEEFSILEELKKEEQKKEAVRKEPKKEPRKDIKKEPKKEPKKENKEPRKEAVKEPKKEVKKDAPKPPKKENNKPAEKEVNIILAECNFLEIRQVQSKYGNARLQGKSSRGLQQPKPKETSAIKGILSYIS